MVKITLSYNSNFDLVPESINENIEAYVEEKNIPKFISKIQRDGLKAIKIDYDVTEPEIKEEEA